jgi:hypothetical protein
MTGSDGLPMLVISAKVLHYVEEMRKRPIFTFKNTVTICSRYFLEK